MSQTTHIDDVRIERDYERKQVLWLTKMTEEELDGFMFETGIAWMEKFLVMHPDLAKELLGYEELWQWWRNEWARVDHWQVLPQLYKAHATGRYAEYRMAHQQIFVYGSPAGKALSRGYDAAIDNLHARIKRQAFEKVSSSKRNA